MTSLLEKIVAIIAPHRCISCSKEDNVMCVNCLFNEQKLLSSICCMCGLPTVDWQICSTCQPISALNHIWPASEYEGFVEQLIHDLKFERVRSAAVPLAMLMADALPFGDWLLVHVPTAPSRVRQRGYDQARLLAGEIAQQRNLNIAQFLTRLTNERQLGSNRVQRYSQSKHMFELRRGVNVTGAKIVLIDDVCTTGATLNAAAACLRAAGAAEIHACVAAWRPLSRPQARFVE